MPTRYQQLRQAIANLAAPAEEQVAHLDRIFEALPGDGSAAGYGNDELALEFDDIYFAAGHMREYGVVTQVQIDAAKRLDELLRGWSGQHNADFWTREALFTDPRWEEVRQCASRALAAFPDEERNSERKAVSGAAIPEFEGMTLNERLIVADELVAWDAAVIARDRREIVRILRMLAVADPDKVAGDVLGSS